MLELGHISRTRPLEHHSERLHPQTKPRKARCSYVGYELAGVEEPAGSS
jgi:hypothetical protein